MNYSEGRFRVRLVPENCEGMTSFPDLIEGIHFHVLRAPDEDAYEIRILESGFKRKLITDEKLIEPDGIHSGAWQNGL